MVSVLVNLYIHNGVAFNARISVTLQAYMEYTSVAVKGAVAAVDGNIPAINCSEHVKYGYHAHIRISSDWSFFLPRVGSECSSGIIYFSRLLSIVVTTTLMLVVSVRTCVQFYSLRGATKLGRLTCMYVALSSTERLTVVTKSSASVTCNGVPYSFHSMYNPNKEPLCISSMEGI